MAEAAAAEKVEMPLIVAEDKPVQVALSDKNPEGGGKDPPAKVVTAEEGIESLKEQVARAKRESAERLAEKDRQIAEAARIAQEAQRETVTVKKDQVGTIIESLTKDKEAARRDYAAAMTAQDFEKAAEAQDRISLANAKIVEAERGKIALEEEAKAPQKVQPINDPADRLAASLSPRSAAWVKAHPEYARDPKLNRQMVRAHEDAIDDGHVADSDSYFEFINEKLGLNSGRQVDRQVREESRAPVSAPVGRDVPQAPGAQRPGSITLQPSEVKAAIETLSPLYPKASRDELLRIYAQNQQDLIAEGKIARRA